MLVPLSFPPGQRPKTARPAIPIAETRTVSRRWRNGGAPRGTSWRRAAVRSLVAAAMVASIIAAVPAAAAAQQDVFSDVAEGVHKPAIDILGEMGLFEGTLCDEGMFCPGEPIKRSDMAVWLIRALEDEELPAAGVTRFADVDADQWWAPYVERLAELEITVGCRQEPLRYCPDTSVSRGQMASFLVRAFDLEPAEPAGFVDTEGSAHEANIDALAASEITVGCEKDPLTYCTSDPVRRSQMATFLARALGLVQAPTPTPEDTSDDQEAEETDDQSPPPSAAFSAVSAGTGHACALRIDGTITCWGFDEDDGETDPPEGAFSAVAAGRAHSCGLRADGTIACWGSNSDTDGNHLGQSDPPDGTFAAVSARWDNSCALRTDGTITCWGANDQGQTDPPDGTFSAVSAGGGHSCALRTDGTISCWGGNTSGQSDPPDGTFSAVSAGGGHSCALRTDGTISCWGGNNVGEANAPDGSFSDVSTDVATSCGLRTDGTIACWGWNKYGQTSAPDGSFSAVSAGAVHSCALRSDGTIKCWGAANVVAGAPG